MAKSGGIHNSSIILCLLTLGFIFSISTWKINLFDLDELYFAEITREMMLTQNYRQVTFHFEPLYEKPPLFFWIQAISMHLWGINEIGARFPNVICGLLTLLTLYTIGKKYKGKEFGFLWMCLHATGFLPHFYFKSGIIDPWLNYFLLLAIYFLANMLTASKDASFCCAISGGAFTGLALLTKGPIGIFIPIVTFIFSFIWAQKSSFTWETFKPIIQQLLVAICIALFIAGCWLIPEIRNNGWLFIKNFWNYHCLLYAHPTESQNLPWYYHFLVLLFGCFPCSLFALAGIKQKKATLPNFFAINLQFLLILVLLIFTLVGTKIVHYSSMAYFPITFFAADFLHQRIHNLKNLSWLIALLFLTIGSIIGICLALLPYMMLHKALFIPFIKNSNIIDTLNIVVEWKKQDSLPGILYLGGVGIALLYLLHARLIPFIGAAMFTNLISLTLFLAQIAPKIECYTQKHMIDFCKEQRNKDVYLATIGFKSAAPSFYAHKPPKKILNEKDVTWLLEGPIDKPCLFIIYKSDKKLLNRYNDIHFLKEQGCFAFYKRIPQ